MNSCRPTGLRRGTGLVWASAGGWVILMMERPGAAPLTLPAVGHATSRGTPAAAEALASAPAASKRAADGGISR